MMNVYDWMDSVMCYENKRKRLKQIDRDNRNRERERKKLIKMDANKIK